MRYQINRTITKGDDGQVIVRATVRQSPALLVMTLLFMLAIFLVTMVMIDGIMNSPDRYNACRYGDTPGCEYSR